MRGLPNNIDKGLFKHQPRSIRNGIQKRVNWIPRSIERPLANDSGAFGLRNNMAFMKYTTTTTASPPNDTSGSRIIPNHLNDADVRERKHERLTGLLQGDITLHSHNFHAVHELVQKYCSSIT